MLFLTSKQLPYPSPILSVLHVLPVFYVSSVIKWKSNCATSSCWEKDWTTAAPNLQVFIVTVFDATRMLDKWVKKTKTQNSQSSNLLLALVFLPHFNYLHFNLLISLYGWKFERSLNLLFWARAWRRQSKHPSKLSAVLSVVVIFSFFRASLRLSAW